MLVPVSVRDLADEPEETETTHVRATFEHVYGAHRGSMRRALVLSGCSPPEAEDLVQEAFARAFSRWHRVSTGTNPAGYVYRIAFRLARRSQKRSTLLRSLHLVEPTAVDELGHPGQQFAIIEALTALPSRQRECLLLRFFLGYETGDIAMTLAIRESTVRSHLQAARKTFEAEYRMRFA